MTNQLLFGLLNLSAAIILYTVIVRARKNKQLKITLISGPITKVQSIILSGRGLKVAIIGWGISTTLLILSGLSSVFSFADLETCFFITFISIIIGVIAMLISSYITPTRGGSS